MELQGSRTGVFRVLQELVDEVCLVRVEVREQLEV